MRVNRIWSLLLLVLAAANAQENPLLPQQQVETLYTRVVQLMESTGAAAPGLARAGAPVIENARQALLNIRAAASRQDGGLHYDFLVQVRAYLELAGAMPKPFPFPQEGRKQFLELRESVDRVESHFRALLDLKERQLREPDRDNLRRYAEANAKVPPPQPDQQRVVFMGDSITDGWRLNEYFPDRDFHNRGISGQITGQMLGRMQADVISLKPAAMVFLGGTNDIARGVALETIRSNLTMIADLALAHNIKPIFASVLPIHDYNKDQDPAYEMSKRRPMATIRALNTWLAELCRKRNLAYLDYFQAMVDPAGFLQKDLAEDGLHPNAAGHRVMAPRALEAIDRVVPPAPPKKKRRFPF